MNHKFIGPDAIMRRAMLKGCGFGDEDIKAKPHIGIVNTITKGRRGMSIYVNSQKSSSRGFGQRAEFRSIRAPSTCGDMIVGEEELKYELAEGTLLHWELNMSPPCISLTAGSAGKLRQHNSRRLSWCGQGKCSFHHHNRRPDACGRI